MTEYRYVNTRNVMYRYKIKTANRFWYVVLTRLGYSAICTPWRTIIVLERYVGDKRLLRHEMAHAAQYERMGRWRFLLAYFWYALRHGYDQNPLEIEARHAERGR